MAPRSGFWETRHGPVHVRVSGSGSPVVLLHSAGLASTQWLKLAGLLTPSHRVIAPDLWGFGRSPHPESTRALPLEADVELVEDIQSQIGESIALVGHSYGGGVAFAYGRRRSARLTSLFGFEPVCFGVLHSMHDEEALEELHQASVRPLADDELWMERFIDYWSGAGHWRRMSELQREHAIRYATRTREVVQALLDDRAAHTNYSGIEVPVTLVGALRSPIAARRVCQVLQSVLPDADYVEIDAGHMAPLEEPELVARLLKRHLERESQ